ncbi:MAG: hypothetical protein IJ985_00430 [Akkermansia sp.]|nr:hypothetical protein [Akkermansia sp.]
MAIKFTSLFKHMPPWFDNGGYESGVIMGTMGRLVRNLKGESFPGWSTSESRARVAEKLTSAVRSLPGFKQAQHAEMTELNKIERRVLLERKLITPCMAARQDGCHVFINKKQDTIIMLNEEEHLAIHQFAAGNRLESIVNELSKKAKQLAKDVEFAHGEEYGFLTSMAAECGDGLQLYMVLHLPGHAMMNQIDKLERALNKMHLNLSPFFNEHGEETGNLYVLFSTPIPMGATNDVLGHMLNIAESIVEKELMLQDKMNIEDPIQLADMVGRVYGTLRYGSMMEYPELLHTLSVLNLAMELEMLILSKEKSALQTTMSNVLLYTAPAHLLFTTEDDSSQVHKILRMSMLSSIGMCISPNEGLSPLDI